MASGVYVHIPFCSGRCRYCGFVSYIYEPEKAVRTVEAIGREAALMSGDLQGAETIFVGGGTPTVLSPTLIKGLLASLKANIELDGIEEFTVEANPGTLDGERAGILSAGGVNRLSLGVQAVNEDELRWLGRSHTWPDAQAALLNARKAGLRNINIDLIYGFPGQTLSSARDTVSRVLENGPSHISLYDITLEEETPLMRQVASGEVVMPEDDLRAEIYMAVCELLDEAGLEQYEVSNFAVPGYRCRHNLNYWAGGEYLGLGPAACSRVGQERYWNHSSPEAYIRDVNAGKPPRACSEMISEDISLKERIMLGLRTAGGLDIEELRTRYGYRLDGGRRALIDRLSREGLLVADGDKLCLTRRGLLLSNSIITMFIP